MKIKLENALYSESIIFDIYKESDDKSIMDKNYKSLNKLNINSFKKVSLSDPMVLNYIKKDRELSKILTKKKIKDLIKGNVKGYFYINGDDLVAYIFVHDGIISPLYIYPKYRKHSLSGQILDFAIKNMGANKLEVYKDNEVAIHLYKKHGFNITDSDKMMYTMSI